MAGSVSFELLDGILEFTMVGNLEVEDVVAGIARATTSLEGSGPFPVITDMAQASFPDAGLSDVKMASDAASAEPRVLGSRRAIVVGEGATVGVAKVAAVVARVWHGDDVEVFTSLDEARQWVLAPPQAVGEDDSPST